MFPNFQALETKFVLRSLEILRRVKQDKSCCENISFYQHKLGVSIGERERPPTLLVFRTCLEKWVSSLVKNIYQGPVL